MGMYSVLKEKTMQFIIGNNDIKRHEAYKSAREAALKEIK